MGVVHVRAFQGLRPEKGRAEQIASVPYDVVDAAEARELARDNPLSLLHVERAEIDLPPDTNPHADIVYLTAAKNFQQLQTDGHLVREAQACLYIYRQSMGDHVQRGVATVCHIEDYEDNVIRKHEKTRRDKEDDRTRLIHQLRADTSPVFLTYRVSETIDALVSEAEQTDPLVDYTAPDDVSHTVWRVQVTDPFIQAFKEVPAAYVADGHHRTASAVRVGRDRRTANPDHTGSEDYNWFLAVLFPSDQLRILAYNRLVHDLNGLSPQDFLKRLDEDFEVRPAETAVPNRPGKICVFVGSQWHLLRKREGADAGPVSALDVSLLQDRILNPLLGIKDPRTDERIEFVGGIRGTEFLEDRVRKGAAAAAFSMHPTTVEQLMAIADAGQIMPPKSTWFEPKLRSGLFIHTFE